MAGKTSADIDLNILPHCIWIYVFRVYRIQFACQLTHCTVCMDVSSELSDHAEPSQLYFSIHSPAQ